MSDEAIGLPLGTSAPGLATTVIAAHRCRAHVATADVIGSDMPNLQGIVGIAALVGPIPVGAQVLTFDLWVTAAAAVLLTPFVLGRDPTRRRGAGLCALHVAVVPS